MFAGLALYPLSDAFIKYLMGSYTVHQTTFLRALTRVVPLLLATMFHGGPKKILSTQRVSLHAVRLAVNLAYTLLFMYAVSFGSLTVVYAISYTSPLFMIALSGPLLKESIAKDRWAAVAIGMIGVVIATHPGEGIFEWTALIVLAGTFLGALNKILMRRLTATEHSLAITIYPNLVMIAVTAPFVVCTWQKMPLSDWGLFAIVGGTAALGQYCIAQALRWTHASTLAPIDYSSLFWVVTIDAFWWDKTPDIATLLGASIIVGSNLFVLYRTHREQLGSVPKRFLANF
jgi:drug/metabolite transporter (DMT)-like permease